MENTSQEIYVTEPVTIKDSLGSYTSYSLKGSRVTSQLSRRYKDFDAYRSKLVERWPGIYIPNIPHKKIIGKKDKEVVEMRIEQINRFLEKITKIDYLSTSEETELFLQNQPDIPKAFANMSSPTYESILQKYEVSFSSFDPNFDIEQSKIDQEKFYTFLKESCPRIKTIQESIKSAKDNFKLTQENNTLFLNMLNTYEKDTMKDLIKSEEQLIFIGTQSDKLSGYIKDSCENVVNPYDKLYDSITDDVLETEAMIESFESLSSLKTQYDKIEKNLNATITQLGEVEGGKKNIKSILSFKSKEKETQSLNDLQTKLENDKNNLDQIIKICIFKMSQEIENFKDKNLDIYYDELIKLDEIQDSNNKIYDRLWDEIINNQNMKNIDA